MPSTRSTERLAQGLHREIEDLRAGLTDHLLLTMILLGEDEVEEAAGILDDGAERLQRFQDSLENVVAAAIAEREAEAVFAEAGDPATDGDAEPTERAFRIRALASAAAVLLAVVVALVSTSPADDPALVAAGATSSGASAPEVPGLHTRTGDGGGDGTTDTADEPVPSWTATSHDRRHALQAAGGEDRVLARLGSEPRRSAVAALFGVDLVDRTVGDATGAVPSETVDTVVETPTELEPLLREATEGSEPQAEQEPSSGDTPSETSSEEPPEDEPSGDEPDEGSSDDPDGSTDDGSNQLPDDSDDSWSALVEGSGRS